MNNVRKLVWCATMVALFVLSTVLSQAALAVPTLSGAVTISGVTVDRNSISGTVASITWSTNPAKACDTVAYRPSGGSTWTTLTPQCGTHAVSLSGLTIFQNYDFTITSTARKYGPGSYSASFYPVDVSQSKAYEGRQWDFSAYGVCGTKYVHTTMSAEMPGDIEYDPMKAQNSAAYELFDVHTKFFAQGEDWCPGYNQLTVKRTIVRFYVEDMTTHIHDWIAAKVDPVPNVASGGYTGSIDWTINLGVDAYGGSIGVSLAYNPPTGIALYPVWHDEQIPGGPKYVAELRVDWDGGKQTSLDIAWPMVVRDSLAQFRLYDKVQIMVGYTLVFDLFNLNGHYWTGYDWTIGFGAFVLGNGYSDFSPNLDQYTNVQMGTSTGPG